MTLELEVGEAILYPNPVRNFGIGIPIVVISFLIRGYQMN